MIRKRPIPFALALTALALSAAAPAQAEEPPSAVEQYIEQIPSARGPVTPPAAGGESGSAQPLPAVVEDQLASEGGDDAPLLRDVVTSPGYGAPTQRLRAAPPTAKADGGTLGAAAATAASSGGSGWLTAVLVGVPLLTIALIAWRRFAPRT